MQLIKNFKINIIKTKFKTLKFITKKYSRMKIKVKFLLIIYFT